MIKVTISDLNWHLLATRKIAEDVIQRPECMRATIRLAITRTLLSCTGDSTGLVLYNIQNVLEQPLDLSLPRHCCLAQETLQD